MPPAKLAVFGIAIILITALPSEASNCSAYPYIFTNGATADANQVNSNFNSIMTCANTALAPTSSPTLTGLLTMNGNSASNGILISDNSATAASPLVTVTGRRDATNKSQSFGGGLALSKWSSGVAQTSGERLGTIYFGGSYDGTLSHINYAATISGIAEANFTGSTAMATGIAFYTGSTGSVLGTANGTPYGIEVMRISSSGNVGIGTASPSSLLNVQGTPTRFLTFASTGRASIVANDNVTYEPVLTLQNAYDGGYGVAINANLGYGGSGSVLGTAILGGRLGFGEEVAWTSTVSTQNSYFTVSTALNGTIAERLRVSSAGNVGIGTSTPAKTLEVNGQVQIDSLASAASTAVCINAGVLASCSSSQRYKKNISPFLGGLDEIERLEPVTFKWIDRNETDLGLIAESVAKVDPLLVTYKDGKIEGVKYAQLTAVLVNAIKQLKDANDRQSARIAELNTRLENQERRLSALESRSNVRTAARQ